MNNNYYSTARVSQHSLVMTFVWMTIGLLVTGITSTFFAVTGLFYYMMVYVPFAVFGLFIVQIALTFAIGKAMRSATSSMMKILFIVYSITFGITMSSLAYAYGLGTLSLAFFVSAVYFICVAIVGLTTKSDMTKIGTFCIGALMAMIISQLIFALFRVPMDTRIMSIVGLLIFTGITVFDVQRATRLLTFDNGDVVTQEKVSIYLALQLYLDFINIFLYIVRLLGNRRR